MRTIERVEDLVAERLVVVRAQPVEAVIKTDVPRIAKTAGNNLKLRTVSVATQDAAAQAPIITGIVVTVFVFAPGKNNRLGKVRRVRQMSSQRSRNGLGATGLGGRLCPFELPLDI